MSELSHTPEPPPSDFAPAAAVAAQAPAARTPLGWLRALYRPEPAAAPLAEGERRQRELTAWRWRMFAGFFLGYAVLYFCRKNISNALPAMGLELHYTNTQLGIIGTSLYVTYGIGKFLNGVLADRSNIRTFMATGLIVSGICNLVFGSLAALWLLALCWGMNGWFQSMGFPPIARGMTIWYPPERKATRWAFWTCSHQAGTAVIMAMTAWILTWGGWRACFWLPGIICIVAGVGLLFVLADTPESRGLPSAKAFDDDEPGRAAAAVAAPGEFRSAFVRYVLKNPNVWVVGVIDLCVYVVRFGTLDWVTKFLHEAKGYSVPDAALRAGMMPLAGVAGVLVSGFVADAIFKTRYREVNAISLLALAACMWGLFEVGPGHPVADLLLLAGIGFFVEGPQSILGGVGAVDAGGSARVASSAAGLVGILAYFGASLSGVGTGLFVDTFGWEGAFLFWTGCALVGLLLCVLVWREKQRRTTPESM